MPIVIPARMKKRLEEDSDYTSKVFSLIANVEPLVHTSPVFFPHYTFHGDSHINTVLELADKLIPDELISDEDKKKLTGRDTAYLISAVILHDLGMFLTIDGFNKLLSGVWKDHCIDGLDRATFEISWEEYLAKVSRYSDEKMRYNFGRRVDVKVLHLNQAEMVEIDKLIIGDFLRQQHPRLAHVIAETSFMGSTDNDILGKVGFDADDRRIIGLIARSHGMAMRDTENYIEENFADLTHPCGTPIFYLMALVRVADLLDAGQHRAPTVLTDRQNIDVPISVREWRWNGLVKIENFTWKTEAKNLHIQASPNSSTDFTLVENWLKWVQQELDMSWSVIAEKYAGEPYRLSIHRVKSNILEPKAISRFSKKFLPKEAKLTANPDLLKLLIHPLYGDNPSYGVRELLQNALDACRERTHLEPGHKGKVTVSLDTKAKTLTVTDNGIGMNEDVILNYFLAAGSSYRHSDDWIKNYTTDSKSKVARTGKFGIGVLAAFLLGKTVQVQTRHCKDEQGYVLTVQLDDKALDIRRIKCDVGTTITVDLSDAVLDELTQQIEHDRDEGSCKCAWYRWYVFHEPDVQYEVDSILLSPDKCRVNSVPQTQDNPGEWLILNSTEYDTYLWKPTFSSGVHCFCNGIGICALASHEYPDNTTLALPHFSVMDTQNNLNVSLSRNQVLDYPDITCLTPELFKYGLAKLLVSSLKDFCFTEFPAFSAPVPFVSGTIIFCKHGYTLVSPCFFNIIKPERFFIALLPNSTKIPIEISLTDGVLVIPFSVEEVFNYLGSSTCVTATIYGNVKWSRFDITQSLLDSIRNRFPNVPILTFPLSNFPSNNLSNLDTAAVVELVMQYNDNQPQSPLLDLIHEYLGDDIWIPYDLEERKKKFPKAFQELKPYMDHIAKYPPPGC